MTTSPASRHARRQATTTARPPRASAGPIPDDRGSTGRGQRRRTPTRGRGRVARTTRRRPVRSRGSRGPRPTARPRGTRGRGRQPQQRRRQPDGGGEAPGDPRPPAGRDGDAEGPPGALQQAGRGEAADGQSDGHAQHDEAAVEGIGERGEREAGERRDDAVVEVRLPLDDEPLDAGDLRVDVEVAAGQGVRLGVVEVARERAPHEQLPRPATGRQQDERDDGDRRADARRPAGIAVGTRSGHEG